MMKLIRKALAWVRIRVWGFCPKCNSDAPELYDCKVCNWDTTSPFTRNKRKEYWRRFKLLLSHTSPCCNKPMTSTLDMELDKLRYECPECKTEWI